MIVKNKIYKISGKSGLRVLSLESKPHPNHAVSNVSSLFVNCMVIESVLLSYEVGSVHQFNIDFLN